MDEVKFTDEIIPLTGKLGFLFPCLLKRAYYNGQPIVIQLTPEFLEGLFPEEGDLEQIYKNNRTKIETIARAKILEQKPKRGEMVSIASYDIPQKSF